MPMILNQTEAMLSITCKGKVLNFVPGVMFPIEKDDYTELKNHRVFKKWCDNDNLVTGSKARKEDISDEINDVEQKSRSENKEK